MKKNFLHIFIYIVATGIYTACSDNWDDKYTNEAFDMAVAPSLRVEQEKLEFPCTKTDKTLEISANCRWTATSSANWLTLSNSRGKGKTNLAVSVNAYNDIKQNRSATITVSNGITTQKVGVTQAMKESLEVRPDKLSFTFEEGSTDITVNANVSWEVSSSDTWLTVLGTNGSSVKVTVQQNIAAQPRVADITIQSEKLKKTIKVTQSGVQLKVSPDNCSFTVNGGSKVFTVSPRNVPWTVSCSKEWLTVNKGADGSFVKVTAKENKAYESRKANITIEGAGQSKTITVTQSGVPAPTVELSMKSVSQREATCKIIASSQDIYITEYGVCYSKSPTMPKRDKADGVCKEEGKYNNVDGHEFNLKNLHDNTTYYIRPYIVTELDTKYGEAISFKTMPLSLPNENDNGVPTIK